MEKFYKIKSENYAYHCIIKELVNEYRVQFGGQKQCINISIYKDDDCPNINGISYDEKCTLNKGLEPGKGTIEMIYAALKFIKYIKPEIKDLYFRDDSKITCENKVIIPLHYFYLSKHGKTWYQTHFNAKLVDKNDRKELKDALNTIRNVEMIKFEEFYNKYFIRCRQNGIQHSLKPIYDESKSYHDFLRKLTIEFDCIVLDSWFGLFWNKICPLVQLSFWKIESKTIETWPDITFKEINKRPVFLKLNQEGGFFPFGNNILILG